MGNKHPTEYHGETCVSCGISLPPCKSFDDFEKTVIDGMRTYVYNGGQYFRWEGCGGYYKCRSCFYGEINARIQQQNREEELQRQGEREAAKQKASENAKKLEEKANEWYRKNINKSIDEDMQQKILSKFDSIMIEDDNEESNKGFGNNGFDRFYNLFYDLYAYELDYLDMNSLSTEDVANLVEPLIELIQNEWLSASPPRKDLISIVQMFAVKLYLATNTIASPYDVVVKNTLPLLVLKITDSVKSKEELIHLTISLLSSLEDGNKVSNDNSIYHLSQCLTESNKQDLTVKSISILNEFLLIFIENLLVNAFRAFPHLQGNSVTTAISSLLIEHAVGDFDYGDCSLKDSISELTRNEKWDAQSIWHLLKGILQRCTSIKEELVHYCEAFHVISTYSIGPNQLINGKDTLISLVASVKAEILARELREFSNKTKDEIKNLDELLEEIHETKLVDTETLESVRSIVSITKAKLKNYGYPGKGSDYFMYYLFCVPTEFELFQWENKVNGINVDTDEEGLAASLTYLSCAVYWINAWWPRDTQLISCCILMKSNKCGRLLQMSTGEGKSCVVAMFAVWQFFRRNEVGKINNIDIITSSPILAQRDAQEWKKFYKLFSLSVSDNVSQKDDKERKACYESYVVYGTVTNFASDILRQEFHMKNIRPSRGFGTVIVDEVDSMMLDQGVQLTYLSHETPGLQHLNPVLSMIWCSVSHFTPLAWETGVMWCAPPQPFFKAMYDSIDPTECGVSEPLQLLLMGETHELVPNGFTDKYEKAAAKATKENEEAESKQDLLAQVSVETIIKFYKNAEEYLPCNFILYTLDEANSIVKVDKPYLGQSTDRVDVSILIAGPGVCCILTHSEEEMRDSIENRIKDLVLQPEDESKPDELMANLPKFLRPFIESRLSIWVENAFYALRMLEGREYLVKGDSILPIDFRSTGIVQLNKKWSNGLHQFLQMKHRLQLTPLTIVTNFLSNVAFFKRYKHSLYGMTGTLGNQIDHDFLTSTYGVKLCGIPTFCPKKLFEYEGILAPNRLAWENSIVESLNDKISPKSWRGKGRAALLICEDINSANELCKLVSEKVSPNVKLYLRNDTDQLNVIHHKLEPQEIVVATNLAGRGTNVKVQDDVKESGGLFVLVTFLPQNARVERQAFGRTARKGDPGSCQIIANTNTLPEYLRGAQSIPNVLYLRDVFARSISLKDDIQEVMLKEKLFEQYCKQLKFFRDLNIPHYQKKNYVTTLNEFWGMWLLEKSDKFDETPEGELLDNLRKETDAAIQIIHQNKSATQNIYPLIRFGNEILLYPNESHSHSAYEMFTRAISIDSEWSLIAYYNRAYCRIVEESGDYINLSIDDLNKAMDSLKKHKEEYLITLQLAQTAKSSVDDTTEKDVPSLAKQYDTKFQILNFFEKNIQDAIDQLNKYKDDDVEAVEKSIFSLIADSNPQIHAELYAMWQVGLINVYSVKKKPRFCWEGLVVFILGALQVVAGIALTVLSAGTLSNIGMGLIGEGISDMIDGVVGMATGEFSWEEWAISKAVGIATSVIGFGVGKILSKGFKAFKLVSKGLSKELKALPKIARAEIKGGLTQVMKENMKNAAKYVGKELAEEGILRGLQYAEDKILDELLDLVKEAIQSFIEDSLHDSLFNGVLGDAIDELVLEQIKGIENLFAFSEQPELREKLEKTLLKLGSQVLDEHTEDLAWQNQLNSAIHGTMEKIKNKVSKEGKLKKYKVLFDIADAIHMAGLAADAAITIQSLVKSFSQEYVETIHQFLDESGLDQMNYNTDSDSFRSIKQELNQNQEYHSFKMAIQNSLLESMSETIVTVVHQKFTSHIISRGEKLLNGKIAKYAGDKFLRGNEIEDRLKAGQASLAISAMSADSDSSLSMNLSYKYADDIKNSTKSGSILDLRILSEKLGVKISILEPLDNNKFRKMLNIHPDSANENSQTLELIYRSASDQYPDGHYDVLKNGKIFEVDSENKNCAYHALTKALHPDDTDEENGKKAIRLRELEIEELMKNGDKWNNFVRMRDQVRDLTNAMWFLGIGGTKIQKRKLLDDKNADTQKIDELKKVQKKYPGDVRDSLDPNFQKIARDRWDAVVVEKKSKTPGTSTEIEMKYKDKAGKDLTNQDLFQTLAFYHEKGNRDADGKLKPLDVEMNIGGTNHHFKMKQDPQGERQILIETINSDFKSTKAMNSYEDISKELDSVEGSPKESDQNFTKKQSDYEKKKNEIIQTRAKMISQAITSTAANQPDFNAKYTLDGKQYPVFNEQQKRAAVSLIATTQIAESCPPDSKYRIMLKENSGKTIAKYDKDIEVSKDALNTLSQYTDKPTRKDGESEAQWKTRSDAYEKVRDEAIEARVQIFKDAITKNKIPTYNETFKASDGKDYDCFSPKEKDAAELYIEVKKIEEYYHKDSDATQRRPVNDLLKDIQRDLDPNTKNKKAVSVPKTGRVPGSDKYAIRLLELIEKSDYDFSTMFARETGENVTWIPVYPPVTSAEYGRYMFNINRV